MSKVINFNDIREKHIKEVEAKASEEYGAIKVGEDSYIIPANVVNTKEIDQDFKDKNIYSDNALIKAIEGIETNDGDYISISCKAILEGNRKVLEVVNMANEEIVDIVVESDLDYQEREMLLNMMADIHKDKSVFFTFHLHYNFSLLEQLVSK